MTEKERAFMLDLAELMAKHEVLIEATRCNTSCSDAPSIQITDTSGEIDIDLYGVLHPDDLIYLAKQR